MTSEEKQTQRKIGQSMVLFRLINYIAQKEKRGLMCDIDRKTLYDLMDGDRDTVDDLIIFYNNIEPQQLTMIAGLPLESKGHFPAAYVVNIMLNSGRKYMAAFAEDDREKCSKIANEANEAYLNSWAFEKCKYEGTDETAGEILDKLAMTFFDNIADGIQDFGKELTEDFLKIWYTPDEARLFVGVKTQISKPA